MALAATATPSTTRHGAAPVALAATGATGSVFWDDNGAGGFLSAGSGLSVTYTPANRTQNIIITATDSLTHVDVALSVRAVLSSTGFVFTQVDLDMALLTSEFGDGFESGVLIGDPAGTRQWTVQIPVLPGDAQGRTIDGLRPAAYLWQFFKATKVAGNAPFWIELEDEDDGVRRLFLASFADNKLSYPILCAKMYSSGLVLKQRRLRDVDSPVSIT